MRLKRLLGVLSLLSLLSFPLYAQEGSQSEPISPKDGPIPLFNGKDDVESPGKQWTRLDVICQGGRITNVVNGVVVNEGFDVSPTAGKILFQSEGAEIFVRRFELWPLGKAPPFDAAALQK